MKALTWRTIGYVLAAALVLYLLGRYDAATSAADARIIAEARAALAAGRPYRATLARLQAAHDSALARAARSSAAAQVASAAADSLGHLADSIRDARAPLPAGPADTSALKARVASFAWETSVLRVRIDSMLRAAADDKLTITSLRAAEATASARAATAEARVTTLETNLKATIAVAQCRIVFVPCPSRPLVFLLGGVAGAIVASKL